MRRKSEVYSWRVSPALKASLEEAARGRQRSLAALLDEIVAGYLAADRGRAEDDETQRRLHAKAERFAGALAGGDPERASKARERVRARLDRLGQRRDAR